MARKMGWRRRMSPQSAFEEHSQELAAAFLNRVGFLFYDTEWMPTALETLRDQNVQVVPGSDADLAAVIRDQVIASLRSGRLTAVVWLTAAARPYARRDIFDDGWEELSNDERSEVLARPPEDPLTGDDATPKQRTFRVNTDVWHMSKPTISVDWAASNITIYTEHLRDDSSAQRCDRPISEFYNVQEVVRDVPLRIRYPFRALRDLVRYEDLPDDAWFERYERYRNKGRVEALAAMWRYLAIGGFSKSNLPTAADLARRASEYLSGQGFSSSREAGRAHQRNSGLEEMAQMVLNQFEGENLSSSVLVSSNPRDRRPA